MLSLQHSLQRAAFGLDDDGLRERTKARERVLAGPVVIEVRGVCKTFRIPDQRVDTVKERVLHPLRRIRVPRAACAAGRVV